MERCFIVVFLSLGLRFSSGFVIERNTTLNIPANETNIGTVTTGRNQDNETSVLGTGTKSSDFGDPFFKSMDELYGPTSFNPGISNTLRNLAHKLHGADTSFVRKRRSSDVKMMEEIEGNCTTHGGRDAFEKYVNAYDTFHRCLELVIDFSVLREDLVSGKSEGMMFAVMAQYCSRVPRIKECVTAYFEAVGACMVDGEWDDNDRLNNMTQAALDYICYREGKRVELFVMEEGIECVGSKLDAVIGCSAETVAPYFTSSNPVNPVADIARLVSSEEGCRAHREFHHCVCSALEDCPETVAADMLDRFFGVMESMMRCQKDFQPLSKVGLINTMDVAAPPSLWNYGAFVITIVVIAVPLSLIYLFFVKRIVRKR